MNISEIFIRRPVTTTLVMASILIFGVMGYRQLPVSDLPNVDFPTIQVGASLPGRVAGDDGLFGRDAARAPVHDDRGARQHELLERAGLDVDHAPVQPEPRPRRRGAGRAVGDRGLGAAAAAQHAEPADVSEGQPGRSAGHLPHADLGDAAALAAGRVRRDDDGAADLDGLRRRAGAGLRPAEVRGARAARPEPARQPRHRHRRGQHGRADGQRQPADRECSSAL